MANNLHIQWRVQSRKSRHHKWVNRGLFETREAARREARQIRADLFSTGGQTHVLRYEKACR